MVRWKKIIGFITLGYILCLFLLGIILTFLMGPGEIYYIDLNGRIDPMIHYHTIHEEWVKLWVPLSILSLPALLILHFLDPYELKEVSSNLKDGGDIIGKNN